jgi:hypothetical protein
MDMEKQGILGAGLVFNEQERAKSAAVTAKTVNNIHIAQVGSFVQNAENSVVQGGVDAVVNMTGVQQARDVLTELTEAVVKDAYISDTQKNELIDQISFLSEQTVAGAKERKPGLIKATFSALTEAAGTVSSMAGAWQAAEPILRRFFS